MKKKLVVMAVLLSAICFTGFAQEAFNSEAPRYIAKECAGKEAIKRFKTWHGDSKGNNLSRLMVRCTSTKDACRL